MRVKHFIASALLAVAGAASAVPVGPGYVGNLDNSGIEIGNTIAAGQSFTDLFIFSVSNTAIGASVVYSIPFPTASTFVAFTLLGFFDMNFVPLAFETVPVDGRTLFARLPAAGNYVLAVTGTAGPNGGIYDGFLVAQLPEPGMVALMALGLFGLTVSRRRLKR